MNKTDWGEWGYLVTGSYYRTRPIQMHEVQIEKIGTKFVYANNDRFSVITGIQASDYGDKCRLFPDRESAAEYVTRSQLLRKLSKYTSTHGDSMAVRMPTENVKKLLEMFEAEEDNG